MHKSLLTPSMQQQPQFLMPPPFETTNTLLYRSSPPSHKISSISKKQQNIQIICIILSKQQPIRTKSNSTITKCLVADESACIYMNFFNETGLMVHEGDIVYAGGIYASHFKDLLLLYQGSQSIVRRVGKGGRGRFNPKRNMSMEGRLVSSNQNTNSNQ